MGKLPESFDDWKWPWKQGEVDEEKAAKLIFNARKAEEAAKEALTTAVADKDSEIEQLTSDLDAAKAAKSGTSAEDQEELRNLRKENKGLKEKADKPDPNHQAEIDRLKDALDFVDQGLPKALALRVQGETAEDRLEDAKELAAAAGVEFGEEDSGSDSSDDGQDSSLNPSREPQRLRSGFERGTSPSPSNPEKAAEKLPPLFA